MEGVAFFEVFMILFKAYTLYAQNASALHFYVTSKHGFTVSAPVVQKKIASSSLQCYAECMQNDECIAVNVYRLAEGNCECHLLADAVTTDADLQENTDAVYMGPGKISLRSRIMF